MSQDVPALVIAEQGGMRRRLVLNGRALPFRPLPFEGIQNVEVTYYPGFPIGTAQPLGPQETSTTIRGAWHDRFIAVVTALESPAMVNGAPILSVADLVETIDSMRILGSEIRLSWHVYNRVGYLKRFAATWLTIHDVEWEAEFVWTRRGDVLPASSLLPSRPRILLPDIMAAQEALLTAINESTLGSIRSTLTNASNVTATFFSTVNDTIGIALGEVANGVQALRSLSQAVSLGTATYEQTMRQAAGVLANIATAYTNAANAVDEVLVYTPAAVLGANPLVGAVIALQTQTAEQSASMRAAARQAQEQGEQANAAIKPAPDEIYTAREGDDLRRVSTLYYGTQDSWIDLAAYNGVVTSTLAPGQVVRVPPGGFAGGTNG